MNILYNNRLAPITSEFGFLEHDVLSTAKTFLQWQSDILQQHDMSMELCDVPANAESMLKMLLPLTTPVRCRYAFVSTGSPWTAFFDNGAHGTDAASVMKVLSKALRCRGIRVVFVPNTMSPRPAKEEIGRFGATILEVYDEQGDTMRSIYAANDGGTWRFGQSGKPFPFEEIDAYQSRRVSDRFNGEMLNRYLKHLGIDAFNEAFYTPNGSHCSIMAKKHGKFPPSLKEITIK